MLRKGEMGSHEIGRVTVFARSNQKYHTQNKENGRIEDSGVFSKVVEVELALTAAACLYVKWYLRETRNGAKN